MRLGIIRYKIIWNLGNVDYWGTGDLQIAIKNTKDFGRAKECIHKAYEEN